MNSSMWRRPRRSPESGVNGLSSATPAHNRSESSSFISACVLFIAMVLFFGYLFGNSVFHHSKSGVESFGRKFKPALFVHSLPVRDEAEDEDRNTTTAVTLLEQSLKQSQASCQVRDAIPLLQDTYGKYMKKVLHIGPGTCDVVSRLLQDEDAEAWGLEPYDMVNPGRVCKNLVRKGLARVADVHRSLPYRSKTFSLVLTTRTLEHLTSRQLNKTLPELARITGHALVAFVQGQASQTAYDSAAGRQLQAAMKPIKHHNRTWWSQRFGSAGLEEDEEMTKRFEALQSERTFTTPDYIFHLLPRGLD